jgi:hypothetical protein
MSFFAVRDTPPPATPLNYFLESRNTLYIGICTNNPPPPYRFNPCADPKQVAACSYLSAHSSRFFHVLLTVN